MSFSSRFYQKLHLILLIFIVLPLFTISDAKENNVVITKDSIQLNGNLANNDAPVSVGLTQSSELGEILNFRYSQLLTDKSAMSLGLEAGIRNQRASLTYGKLWSDKEKLKVTAELLRQKGEYQFSTGNTREWINQYALGMHYQHPAPVSLKHFLSLDNISFGAKYVKANSKNLSDDLYQTETATNSVFLTNERQLSGATRQSINVGATFKPRTSSRLQLGLLYDDVRYSDSLNGNIQSFHGIGTNLAWQEQLSKKTKLSLSSSINETYNRHQLQISHLLDKGNVGSYPASLDVGISHQTGRHGLGDDSRIMVNYNLGKSPITTKLNYQPKNVKKQLFTGTMQHDVLSWIKHPAVYENRVLATAKQKLNTITRDKLITVTKIELTSITIEMAQNFGFLLNTSNKQKSAASSISYAVTGLPEGLSIDSSTGVISGKTPDVESKRSFPVTVTATSTDGNSFSITFTLIVLPIEKSTTSRVLVTQATCAPDNAAIPAYINNIDLGLSPYGCNVDISGNGSDGIRITDDGVIRISELGPAVIDSILFFIDDYEVTVTAASGRRYLIQFTVQRVGGVPSGVSFTAVRQI